MTIKARPITVEEAIDEGRLTPAYWSMASAVLVSQMLEYFDFFLAAFVVSLIAKPWNLTYGASTAILVSSGLGAIVGSAAWGWMSDRWGRRPLLIAAIIIDAVGTGMSALTPTGWWEFLMVFRILVGVGVGGCVVTGAPVVIEWTPSRHRTLVGGLMTNAFIPIGTLVATLVTATLSAAIGFRGILFVGLAPAVVGIWVYFSVPESARWLAGKGRADEAARNIAKMFNLGYEIVVSGGRERNSTQKTKGYKDAWRLWRPFWAVLLVWLFADSAAIGLTDWAPTLLTRMMGISTGKAAALFSIAVVCGLLGRVGISFLARRVGRKVSGILFGGLAFCFFVLTAVLHSAYLGTVPFFLVGAILAYLFTDGSFGNIVPFTSEVWPNDLRGHGSAVGNAMGGVGKIVGPVVLALIVGASNLVSPEATVGGVFGAFMFFGACMAVTAVVYGVIAPEPHGKTLSELENSTPEDDAQVIVPVPKNM